MSETVNNLQPETRAPNAELVATMLSDESFARRLTELQEGKRGEYDAAIGHVARLINRARDITEAGIHNPEPGAFTEADNKAKRIRRYAAHIFGKKAVKTVYRMENAQTELPNGRLEYWGDEAEAVYDKVMAGSPLIDDGIDKAVDIPPATITDTSEADYKAYLGKKLFISDKTLQYHSAERSIVLLLDEGQTVNVPIQNVVSAGSLDSWMGQGYDGNDPKERTLEDGRKVEGRSFSAIKEYAERSTELPPVEEIDAYVQPDGTVLFSPDVSNHRTAAAIARGYTELAVANKITIHQLDTDLVPRQEDV